MSNARASRTGGIQLEPPETARWSQRHFPHQIALCMLPDFQCAASTRRPPIVAKQPAAASCPSQHRPRTPPSRRTTQSQKLSSYDSRCGRALLAGKTGRSPFTLLDKQACQCSVHLPGRSNLFLTLVEEIDKFLSTVFWRRLDETKTKTVCSQPVASFIVPSASPRSP